MHFKKVFAGRQDFFIALIFLMLGFVVRWWYILHLDISDPLRGDAGSYYIYAKNLIEHGVFSRDRTDFPVADSYWAPGYPVFLAICFKLSIFLQVNFYPLTLFLQACMGGFIALFTYLTGRFFFLSAGASIASLLTVFSPHLNSLGGNILSETLFTLLLLSSIYVSLIASRESPSPSWKVWSLAGILFGLTYLTNPVVLFVPFLILLLCIFKRRKVLGLRKLLKVYSPFLIFFLVFVAAWQIRDMANVSSERESISDRAFLNLVIGSHDDYHAIWRENILERNYTARLLNPADQDYELYKNDHAGFYRELLNRIWANPQHYLYWYFIQKPLDFFGWNILAGEGDIYQYPVNSTIYHSSTFALITFVVMKQLHLWLVGAAMLGLYFALREQDSDRKQAVLFVYVSLFYVTALYVLLHTDGRYSIPLRPEIYLCAVYSIGKIFALAKKLNTKMKSPVLS